MQTIEENNQNNEQKLMLSPDKQKLLEEEEQERIMNEKKYTDKYGRQDIREMAPSDKAMMSLFNQEK